MMSVSGTAAVTLTAKTGGIEVGIAPEPWSGKGLSQRSPLWLPLLQRLTEVSQSWMVFKNAESAFNGFGDVDSSAPRDEHKVLIEEFRSWAERNRLGPVVVCEHAPTLAVLVALSGAEPFFALDLSSRKIFLGSTMFTPRLLRPLAEIDNRGFRRLRPGAEGMIKLLLNGTRRDGHPNVRALEAKDVPRLLALDPEGVRQAARMFGPAEKATVKLAHAVVMGGWDRRAALTAQGWFVLRAVTEPKSVRDRARFRIAVKRCPLLRAAMAGRRVPAHASQWLDEVRRTHDVYDAGAASP